MCRARQNSELAESMKRKDNVQFCVEYQFIIAALLSGNLVEIGRRVDSSTEILFPEHASIFYEIHLHYFTVGIWIKSNTSKKMYSMFKRDIVE